MNDKKNIVVFFALVWIVDILMFSDVKKMYLLTDHLAVIVTILMYCDFVCSLICSKLE